MADHRYKQTVHVINLKLDSALQEEPLLQSDREVLLSPRDRARRQKIIETCFGGSRSPKDRRRSSSSSGNNNPIVKEMYSSYQNPMQAFTVSNDSVFEAFEQGLSNRETSFNFPQKPIEQLLLKQEEVEIEQRANRKRKETQQGDCSNEVENELPNEDTYVKEGQYFQRVTVGEESALGVSQIFIFISVR